MHQEIMDDVLKARGEAEHQSPQAAQLPQTPFMQKVVEQARYAVSMRELMTYLADRYTVTGMSAPPSGFTASEWALHLASRGEMLAHLYSVAHKGGLDDGR